MADDLKTGDRMARAAMTTEPMVKEIAERYLASRGYEILARDWRCEGESVDIVAKDGDVAVLVDVAAGGGDFAEVEAAADRLVRAAELFCDRFDVERGACRIDCLRPRPRHDQALHRRRRRRARLLDAQPRDPAGNTGEPAKGSPGAQPGRAFRRTTLKRTKAKGSRT